MKRTRTVLVASSLALVLLLSGLVVAGRARKDDLYRALGNLAQVVHLINSQYVDRVNLQALGEGLDAGLVESVDARAAVLDEAQVRTYQEMLKASPPYGLVLGLRLGSAAVRQALPGSPSAAAGLKPWEILEKVEKLPTRGQPLWQVRLLLWERSHAGQPIHLTVVGSHVEKRREVDIAGGAWKPEIVVSDDRDGIRVVTIKTLPSGAAARIGETLGNGPVVLDLRHLVWGEESVAIQVADLFASSGPLAVWKGRRAGSRTFAASSASAHRPLPVVLVGSDTEGVGEVLAAALKRVGCTLVGTPTLGRAEHMMLVRDGDLNLWLPVAHWLGADGKPISDRGVVPDEKVKVAGAKEGTDPVLDRGLEVARGVHAKAA